MSQTHKLGSYWFVEVALVSSLSVPDPKVPWDAQVLEILESISDAFYFVDTEWRIRYVNRHTEQLWGRSRAELLGRVVWECFPNSVGTLPHQEHLRAVQEGKARAFETISPIFGRWVGVNLYPTGTGLSVYFRDISAAKRAEEERRFLERATEALVSSLDYHTTLNHLAQLIVPQLADWCTVYTLEGADQLVRVALAHSDPARQPMLEELHRCYPLRPDAPQGPMAVLRTGHPQLASNVTDDGLRDVAVDEAHLDLLRQLSVHTFLAVPLIARGRTIGVLSLVGSSGRMPFEEADVAFAAELARRAALAVDNAHLYHLAQQEIRDREEAERALREREAQLRLALQGARAGSWTCDLETGCMEWSEECFGLYGRDPSRFQPNLESWLACIHEDDRSAVERATRRALQLGCSHHIEFRVVHAGGEVRWLVELGQRVSGAPDKSAQFSGITLDITERKRVEQALRESEERLRFALQAARAGAWDFDTVTRHSAWSPETYELFGLNSRNCEARFRNLLDVVHPGDKPRVQAVIEHGLKDERAMDIEYRILHSELGLRWIHSVGRTYNSVDGRLHVAGIVMDVTARKQAQEALQAINETLEQRISERTAVAEERARQLQAMASELALVEQRERRQLAVELHDYLAQLLVVCRLRLHRLRQEPRAGEDARDLDEMDELLEESLRYTRTLVAELSPTILYDAGLSAAISWLATRMERHGLNVTVQADEALPPLPDDIAIVLFQIGRELLFNVVKHAQVEAAVVCLRMEEEDIVLEVRDAGRGFPRHEPLQGKAPGGFGLFNARERLQILGGSLHFASIAEQGTTVTVRLPLAAIRPEPDAQGGVAEQGTAGQARRKPDAKSSGLKILLADDHQLVREGLRTMIDAAPDMQVVGEAANGEEAVAKARELDPHVVVMDVNMPKMNGIHATRAIKHKQPHVFVVGLSVHDDVALAAAMRSAGASEFLTKGGASAELYRAIRELFNKSPA